MRFLSASILKNKIYILTITCSKTSFFTLKCTQGQGSLLKTVPWPHIVFLLQIVTLIKRCLMATNTTSSEIYRWLLELDDCSQVMCTDFCSL